MPFQRPCRGRLAASLLLLVVLQPSMVLAQAVPAGVATETATALRRSVGQLWVPARRFENGYARHFEEHCSATLVTTDAALPSRVLLSAWHCIEHYRDLSRDLVFETSDGRRHRARILASGGAMASDWAVLGLREALPGGMVLAEPRAEGPREHVMAGFPRREEGDALLVLRAGCRVTGEDGKDLRSDCVLSKGASGGAVVDALRRGGRYRGVISRGDASTVSIFVPLHRFYRKLLPHLPRQAVALGGP